MPQRGAIFNRVDSVADIRGTTAIAGAAGPGVIAAARSRVSQ